MNDLDEKLIQEVKANHISSVKKLLNQGANPNTTDVYNITPIIIASANGHIKILRVLLNAGADIDAKDQNGWTALMEATVKSHKEIVLLLLKTGANPTIKNNDGDSALDMAKQFDIQDIVKLLEEYMKSWYLYPLVQEAYLKNYKGIRKTTLPMDIIKQVKQKYLFSKNKRKKITIVLKKSNNKNKKYMAIFTLKDGRKKIIHFGAKGYSDYTIHKDPKRKQRYISRHRSNEKWTGTKGLMTAGALSLWILWNKTTLRNSLEDYKRKLNRI
jgi:hypothetical protein